MKKSLFLLVIVALTLSCQTENELRRINKAELQKVLEKNADFKSLVVAQIQNTLVLIKLTEEQDAELTKKLDELEGSTDIDKVSKLYKAFNFNQEIINNFTSVKGYLDSHYLYNEEDFNTCLSDAIKSKYQEFTRASKDGPGDPAIITIFANPCFSYCLAMSADVKRNLIEIGTDAVHAGIAAENQYVGCIKGCTYEQNKDKD